MGSPPLFFRRVYASADGSHRLEQNKYLIINNGYKQWCGISKFYYLFTLRTVLKASAHSICPVSIHSFAFLRSITPPLYLNFSRISKSIIDDPTNDTTLRLSLKMRNYVSDHNSVSSNSHNLRFVCVSLGRLTFLIT